MSRPYLSIVVPAYNEAERLPQTLLDMDARLRDVPFTYEIIVVDDGSRDDTVKVVSDLGKRIQHVQLLGFDKNAGKGCAVRLGMLQARGTVRLFADADNATSIDQFQKMEPHLRSGCDVVIGSRNIPGSVLDPPAPVHRRLVGIGLNSVVRTLVLPGMYDTQCGFKAFTADAAERIFSRLRTTGWGFDVEVLALAKAMGYKIQEIPVHWVNGARSTVRLASGPAFLHDVFKSPMGIVARIVW